MFYSKQYDKYIAEGTAFTLGEVQYPSNWLNCASAKEKAEAGLVEVTVVGSPANDAYYWVSTTLENGVMIYVNTPKELSAVQETAASQVKSSAYSLLQPTDYIDLRNLRDPSYKPDWMTWRDAVRQESTKATGAITAATTVEEVQAAVEAVVWPKDPNYVPPTEEQV